MLMSQLRDGRDLGNSHQMARVGQMLYLVEQKRVSYWAEEVNSLSG